MTKIIEFPNKTSFAQEKLESHLKNILKSKGFDNDTIIFATKKTKEMQRLIKDNHYSLSIKLPDTLEQKDLENIKYQVEKGIQEINNKTNNIINKLGSELLMAEIKLYLANKEIK